MINEVVQQWQPLHHGATECSAMSNKKKVKYYTSMTDILEIFSVRLSQKGAIDIGLSEKHLEFSVPKSFSAESM